MKGEDRGFGSGDENFENELCAKQKMLLNKDKLKVEMELNVSLSTVFRHLSAMDKVNEVEVHF